eukprot:TRINITY_DN22223_c0_g1_i1.p1 TRINITY_DN22223_c0_g1~~TRINITY_DN22223_c0_g1_i1.p1  ORF type:complete len:119 (+),score=2.71 TRINITY_DN22223_c0_g1_i1:84-440(+)
MITLCTSFSTSTMNLSTQILNRYGVIMSSCFIPLPTFHHSPVPLTPSTLVRLPKNNLASNTPCFSNFSFRVLFIHLYLGEGYAYLKSFMNMPLTRDFCRTNCVFSMCFCIHLPFINPI